MSKHKHEFVFLENETKDDGTVFEVHKCSCGLKAYTLDGKEASFFSFGSWASTCYEFESMQN
jgi:hypothetical protein